MPEFSRVAVIGYGQTGSALTELVTQTGAKVVVVDTAEDRLDAVFDDVRRSESIADVADADLVIEAVPDDRAIKAEVLAAVVGTVTDNAVIATTTSTLSVTDLAELARRPDRFAGLHLLRPDNQAAVVEVVAALQTSSEVIDRLSIFVTELGKDPIPVKDRPGFLINRLLLPYLNDVIQAYDDGLASAEDLDTAIRLGLGYKQGPFELLDQIGLAVHENATRRAYEALSDPVFAPPPLLQAMVAAGRLGDKNGKGIRNLKERS